MNTRLTLSLLLAVVLLLFLGCQPVKPLPSAPAAGMNKEADAKSEKLKGDITTGQKDIEAERTGRGGKASAWVQGAKEVNEANPQQNPHVMATGACLESAEPYLDTPDYKTLAEARQLTIGILEGRIDEKDKALLAATSDAAASRERENNSTIKLKADNEALEIEIAKNQTAWEGTLAKADQQHQADVEAIEAGKAALKAKDTEWTLRAWTAAAIGCFIVGAGIFAASFISVGVLTLRATGAALSFWSCGAVMLALLRTWERIMESSWFLPAVFGLVLLILAGLGLWLWEYLHNRNKAAAAAGFTNMVVNETIAGGQRFKELVTKNIKDAAVVKQVLDLFAQGHAEAQSTPVKAAVKQLKAGATTNP